MKSKSTLRLGSITVLVIFFLFGTISNAKPIDYEDVEHLLPTEPQTTNDTLAAIVQDPVVQDAVQSAVGNGSLQGLVVKKKVFIMPATEPTKVVSQREQVLVVPMMHLEDVRKNITETVTAETDVDGLTLTNIQSFTENGEKGNTDGANNPFYVSQPVNFYEALTETSKPMRKPTIPIETFAIPQKIPYFISNPSLEMADYEPPAISVPIIAFLNPSKISDDKIDVPITAALPIRDDFLKSQLNYLENERDDIQRDVENYADKTSWNVQPYNRRLFSAPSEIQASSSPYDSITVKNQDMNNIRSEISSSRFDIVRPLLWTSDADSKYPTHPDDMDVAADIVFRPLFKYRQEAQQRSYRRSAYRRYNSYPRRRYNYGQYSSDYY